MNMTPMERLEEALNGYSLKANRDDALHELCTAARVVVVASKPPPYQTRAQNWMMKCFDQETCRNKLQRGDRFLEEALELVQTIDGYDAARANRLVAYTFGRPSGQRGQEVGGVMVTLAALCSALDLDMDNCAETELTRVWGKIDQIRAKQASKNDIHSPLPGGAKQPPGAREVLIPVHKGDPNTWHINCFIYDDGTVNDYSRNAVIFNIRADLTPRTIPTIIGEVEVGK